MTEIVIRQGTVTRLIEHTNNMYEVLRKNKKSASYTISLYYGNSKAQADAIYNASENDKDK